MTSRINAELAPVAIEERLRAVREHRYTLPIVREIPRPVGRESLDRSIW